VHQLLGLGIYSQPEAAHLLKMTPSRLRRWVNGYTYWLSREASVTKRARPPVLQKSDLPIIRHAVALSFLELMELRVIRILVDELGVPLQTVRKKALDAQRIFATRYPFATRRVFAEGRRVFAGIVPGEDETDVIEVAEIASGKTEQVQWAKLYEPVMREVQFDPETSFARRWWPFGPETPVVLDPSIMFGAPVIAGSRLRTAVAARMARVEGEEATAAAYRIPPQGVRAAVQFEKYLAAA
jgi:uncharacterized protein (DUF433 family)